MPHSTTSVTSEHSTYLKLSVLSFGPDASTDWQLCKIHAYMPSCHRSSKTPTRPWTSGQAQSCLFACESLRGLHDSILSISKISRLYSVWAIAFRSGSCPPRLGFAMGRILQSFQSLYTSSLWLTCPLGCPTVPWPTRCLPCPSKGQPALLQHPQQKLSFEAGSVC